MSIQIIKNIGSPFISSYDPSPPDAQLIETHDAAFQDRVELLYLSQHRKPDWDPKLENLYQKLEDRRIKTLSVISEVCGVLNTYCPGGYVIFKSIRPYPATPNDTDILFLDNKEDFLNTLEYLYSCDYQFHEGAPLQTTIYDPRGKGKVGPGKLGGTYYIDCYREISTDYYVYIDKEKLTPFIEEKELMGITIKNLQPEPELAIMLFHNVFPEKTFLLEHFYMTLYYLADSDFDIDVFTRFVENHRLVYPVVTNLSLIEYLHNHAFGNVPTEISSLLDLWGRNNREIKNFVNNGLETPYLFSGKVFWKTFGLKSLEWHSFKSVLVEAYHMLNPVFLWDVVKTLKRRFSDKGVYHHE